MSELKATHTGSLTLAAVGVEYEGAVLEDGQRVIAVPSATPETVRYRTPDGQLRHGLPIELFVNSVTREVYDELVRAGARMKGVPEELIEFIVEGGYDPCLN